MTLSRNVMNSLIAGAFAVGMASGMHQPANAAGKDMEKCYGVVKAGHNDCGNAAKTHSCAGQASVDGDGGEWVAVPKGLCDKLVGGSTTPYEGTQKGGENKNG